ncbi:integrase, catalytic region, zinc finger, CCHC-type containing protein [Tanacetum coccineum]
MSITNSNPKNITDPTTAMNMALVLMAKAFKLNYSTPTNNNQRISSNPITECRNQLYQDAAFRNMEFRMLVTPECGQIVCVTTAEDWSSLLRNCTVRPKENDAAYPPELSCLVSKLFMVSIDSGLLQAYDRESKASHQFREELVFLFINLDGVDLLKGNRSTNLYTINLHEMASASPICLMARATSTKSWLWHQRLSHLNFDTINDLAKNDLGHAMVFQNLNIIKNILVPPFEQEKSKGRLTPTQTSPNSKQRSKDEAPEVKQNLPERKYCPSIISLKPDISFLHVFGALCYPKNDREDIGKLGAKGDIGYFIGILLIPSAYMVYNEGQRKSWRQ